MYPKPAKLYQCCLVHITNIIISSYYCLVHTTASLLLLLFTSFSHYFPTPVTFFSRLQLLHFNCELTFPCQVPTSENVKAIILCIEIHLLCHFIFSHFIFSHFNSITFKSAKLTNVISPYIIQLFTYYYMVRTILS